MLNNGNKQECGFADDIVAYIYDEIGSAERGKFESHLAGCTACTDEFAGISNARFSIFEWQKEEFAHLSTPEIVIPYAPKKREGVETAGIFAGLRDLLTLSSWSSAVMVAGAVVICIGLGFVAVNYLSNSSQVAGNNNPVVTEQAVPLVTAPNQPDVAVVPTLPSQKESNLNTAITASNKTVQNREIRPVRATMQTRRVRFEKNLTASTQTVQPLIQQKRKAPALTAYADEDDKSLRLADLFDEGGS